MVTRRAQIQATVEERRQRVVDRCAARPHDTVELQNTCRIDRYTLKNDLVWLEKQGRIVRLGLMRHARRGGPESTLWGVPEPVAPDYRELPAPKYAFKTRWVTHNPYNPQGAPSA